MYVFSLPLIPQVWGYTNKDHLPGKSKEAYFLCDQRINNITSLGLNILLGKTRRLASIVWLYDSTIIKCLIALMLITFPEDSKPLSDFHICKPISKSVVALNNKILSSLLLILCHLILWVHWKRDPPYSKMELQQDQGKALCIFSGMWKWGGVV